MRIASALFAIFALVAPAALFTPAALAAPAEAPTETLRLILKDHRFTPAAVVVPAGRKVRIELINEDGASEEFDSGDLNVEEDVTPHGRTSFVVGPLAAGRYAFMGEYHADTAQGTITAQAAP